MLYIMVATGKIEYLFQLMELYMQIYRSVIQYLKVLREMISWAIAVTVIHKCHVVHQQVNRPGVFVRF